MKNQFKVVTWTQDVTKYSEPVKVEGEWGEVVPSSGKGTTSFKIELSTVHKPIPHRHLGQTTGQERSFNEKSITSM